MAHLAGLEDATRVQRRGQRYLDRFRVRLFTKNPRIAGCGRWLNGSAEGTVEVKLNDGVAHFSGLQSCGSVWSCPCCSAKIRHGRSLELEEGISGWLARGGGVEFVTLTVPHSRRDDLAATFDTVANGWRLGVVANRFRQDRDRFGIEAYVRTIEVTYGANGWHPHIHALLFTSKPLDARRRAILSETLFDRWAGWVRSHTGAECTRAAFRMAAGGKGAGQYLVKLQGGPSAGLGLSREFTRQDLKVGRMGSVTPFELIDRAADGEAWALCRWWEWECSTKGRRCLTGSLGWRKVVGLLRAEKSDLDLATEDVGGEAVGSLPGEVWAEVVKKWGAECALLRLVEVSGAEGLRIWLGRDRAGP